ncbi:ricin B lectin domain-containing protein, partial [Mycena vulgaris]
QSLVFNAGFQGCISAADNEDGASVSIHDCSTGEAANKNWTVSFYEGQNAVGPQQLKVFGNKCLDVTSGTNTDGVALQIWTCSAGNTNQQWISLPDQTFQWAGTNKCIDLRDGKIADGTELQIWTCDSKNNNQQWIDRALHSYL